MTMIIILTLLVGSFILGFDFGYKLAKKRYYIDENFNYEEAIDKILETRKKHKKHIEEIDNEIAKIKYMEKQIMKAADIKEFIQNSKVKIESMLPPNAKKKADEVLREVLSMLDELEERPKAHWKQTELSDELYADIERCTNCGYESLEKGNFCAKCGAKMVEPKESKQ